MLKFATGGSHLPYLIATTFQFMLPGLMHTVSQPPRMNREGPSVLVLLPTRELAQQVQEVSVSYCHALGLKVILAYFCCFSFSSNDGTIFRVM